jgi:hypothetical protein
MRLPLYPYFMDSQLEEEIITYLRVVIEPSSSSSLGRKSYNLVLVTIAAYQGRKSISNGDSDSE